MQPSMFQREVILDYRVRWLGLIPAVCVTFHAVYNLFIRLQPGNLWWMCHVTSILLAVGLIGSFVSLVRVVAAWTILGLPIWAVDAFAVGTTRIAVLSHILVPATAIVAMSQVRAPRSVWRWTLSTVVFYVVVQRVGGFFADPALNVNLAHRIYPFFGSKLIGGYYAYWFITLLLNALALHGLHVLFARRFPLEVVDGVIVEPNAPPPVAGASGDTRPPRRRGRTALSTSGPPSSTSTSTSTTSAAGAGAVSAASPKPKPPLPANNLGLTRDQLAAALAAVPRRGGANESSPPSHDREASQPTPSSTLSSKLSSSEASQPAPASPRLVVDDVVGDVVGDVGDDEAVVAKPAMTPRGPVFSTPPLPPLPPPRLAGSPARAVEPAPRAVAPAPLATTRPPAWPLSTASDGYLFDVDAGGPTRPSTSAATQLDVARPIRDAADEDAGVDEDAAAAAAAAEDADTESSLDAPTVPVDLRALGLAHHAVPRPPPEPSPAPAHDAGDDPDTDPFDAPTIAGGLFVPGPPGRNLEASPTSFPPLPRSAK